MIRRLRIKFVCVVMAIVLVLLSGILGVVVYFTAQSMRTQSISVMRSIAASPFQQSILNRPIFAI